MKRKDLDNFIKEQGLLKNINSCAGIYAITLDGYIVYVGQSKDVYQRCSEHIYKTENAMLIQEKKYLLLLSAKIGGHDIDYKVLEYCKEKDLRTKEDFYISTHMPALNIDLPDGTRQNIEVLKIGDLLSYIEDRQLNEAIKLFK